MSSRRLLGCDPGFSQREVIKSLGNSRRFRNPFRVDLKDGFPKALDERQKEHERMFGTQDKGFAEKGKPI